MNILILSNEFPPLGGGTANELFFTLQQFEKFKDLQIDLVTASSGEFRRQNFTSNSTIHFLNIGKKNQNLHFQTIPNLIVYSWKTFFHSLKLLSSKKYHLVFCYSGIPAGFIGLLLKIFGKIPYVLRLQGSDVPFYEKRWYWLDKFIFSWLSPIIWKYAFNVHANSEGLKKLAQKVSPKQNIGVICNGVNIDFFISPSEKFSHSKIIILAVGRLVERKNFGMIVQAVAKIKKNNQIEIQIAGNGPEKEFLSNLAKELKVNLKLFGEKTKNELVEIYQKADIFVLPSKNEGMSNSVLEAMACGLPCIVSDVGGSDEMIENGKNGFILPQNNETYLQKSIEYLLEHPEQMVLMGNNSRKKAEERSWETVAKNLFKIFTQVSYP